MGKVFGTNILNLKNVYLSNCYYTFRGMIGFVLRPYSQHFFNVENMGKPEDEARGHCVNSNYVLSTALLVFAVWSSCHAV